MKLADPQSRVVFTVNKMIGKDDLNKLYIARYGRQWGYAHWCMVTGTVSRVGELYDRFIDMDPIDYVRSWGL